MALTGRNSYISPEPKRCVERKVLNCLARIIAKVLPLWGGSLPNLRAGESKPSLFLPWKGLALPLYYTTTSGQNLTRLFAPTCATTKCSQFASRHSAVFVPVMRPCVSLLGDLSCHTMQFAPQYLTKSFNHPRLRRHAPVRAMLEKAQSRRNNHLPRQWAQGARHIQEQCE